MSTPDAGDELDAELGLIDQGPPIRRDRREHGGAPDRFDDDALAARTEQERADAGVTDYDPDEVPPATDVDPEFDVTATEEFEEEVGEIKRQAADGELYPLTDEHPFPPTRYDE